MDTATVVATHFTPHRCTALDKTFTTATYTVYTGSVRQGKGGMALLAHRTLYTFTIHPTTYYYLPPCSLATFYCLWLPPTPQTPKPMQTTSSSGWTTSSGSWTCTTRRTCLPLVVLIDANTDSADSLHLRKPYRDSNALLQRFAQRNRIPRARAHADDTYGPDHTWVSPSDTTARQLDYITLSSQEVHRTDYPHRRAYHP